MPNRKRDVGGDGEMLEEMLEENEMPHEELQRRCVRIHGCRKSWRNSC